MPCYLYKNPKTGEIKEVIQRMTEKHSYTQDGVEWERVFISPQTSVDTKIDLMNSQDFVEKTGRKKGNLGNLFDLSKEASDKRVEKFGEDPVKKKYYEDYSKKRGGKKHPDLLKPDNINIEL